jgi:hypothetical protein
VRYGGRSVRRGSRSGRLPCQEGSTTKGWTGGIGGRSLRQPHRKLGSVRPVISPPRRPNEYENVTGATGDVALGIQGCCGDVKPPRRTIEALSRA